MTLCYTVSFSRQALTCVVYDRTFQIGSSQLLRILTVTFRKRFERYREKVQKRALSDCIVWQGTGGHDILSKLTIYTSLNRFN